MTRTIAHGQRTGYASLGAGGLNNESFPMKLFLKGNARHWNPADIDMSQQPFTNQGEVRRLRIAASGTKIQQRKFSYPRVIHPMVFTQAETGRKVLNVSPGFALGIYEDATAEGDALLREVIEVCTDPAFCYYHRWQTDDMVLWDNWRTLHCAKGVPADQTRVMERTTITGDYALGRPLGLDGPVVDFDV